MTSSPLPRRGARSPSRWWLLAFALLMLSGPSACLAAPGASVLEKKSWDVENNAAVLPKGDYTIGVGCGSRRRIVTGIRAPDGATVRWYPNNDPAFAIFACGDTPIAYFVAPRPGRYEFEVVEGFENRLYVRESGLTFYQVFGQLIALSAVTIVAGLTGVVLVGREIRGSGVRSRG